MTENRNPEPPQDIPEVSSSDTLGEAQPINTRVVAPYTESEKDLMENTVDAHSPEGQIARITAAQSQKSADHANTKAVNSAIREVLRDRTGAVAKDEPDMSETKPIDTIKGPFE